MQKEMCELVVSVFVYSFFNKTVEFVFLKDTLDKIDTLTSRYKNKEQFFSDNKRYIASRITSDFEQENGFSPTSMELGEGGIYIKKGERKISPLFDKIGQYDIEDVVASFLSKGNLLPFYKCDKRRMDDDYTYESFFAEFDEDSKERLDKDIVTSKEIMLTLSTILLSTRRNPAVRFILTKTDNRPFKELYKLFCETIPDMEVVSPPVREEKKSSVIYEYNYRHPYRDD